MIDVRDNRHRFAAKPEPMRGCRVCARPLFHHEVPFQLCRNCYIADVQPAQIQRRADGHLFVLPAQVLDRIQALLVGQLPPLRLRLAERFEVTRRDGSVETVYR